MEARRLPRRHEEEHGIVQIPIRWVVASALACAVLFAGCGDERPSSPPREGLRDELLRLGAEDQADREGFVAGVQDEAYSRRLIAADAERTTRLKQIVGEHGWPTVEAVGRGAVHAAWLLLQHSPDHEFQAAMLPAIERAARSGELGWMEVANLTDRVLVGSGQPQRYGQSFAVVDGVLVAHPIEDPERLEDRRAARGLPPMADYVKLLAETTKTPVQWP